MHSEAVKPRQARISATSALEHRYRSWEELWFGATCEQCGRQNEVRMKQRAPEKTGNIADDKALVLEYLQKL